MWTGPRAPEGREGRTAQRGPHGSSRWTGPPPLRIIARMGWATGVKVVKNVMIPMRDGCWPPTSTCPRSRRRGWPVVMEYIPYRKDEVAPGHRASTTTCRSHGYVVARVDIRGTGGIARASTPTSTCCRSSSTATTPIEWLRRAAVVRRPRQHDGHLLRRLHRRCRSRAHAPPHLTSIIPMDFTDDRYTDDCHYRGGLLRKYYDVGLYGNLMVACNALPPYPEWSGGDWARDLGGAPRPATSRTCSKWLAPPDRRPVLAATARCGDVADRIRCPVFMIGGWRDGYPNPPLRLYQSLDSAEEGADRPVGSRAARRRRARPADRLPARGGALARPLVQGPTTPASWTSRPSSSTCSTTSRPSSTGSTPRASGAPRRLAAARRRSERTLYLGDDGRARRRARAPTGDDEFDYDPAVGVTGRPVVGRPAVRPARRPAARRGVLARLHHAAAGRGRRTCSAGRAPMLHVSSTATRDRLRGQPLRRRARRHLAPRGEGHAERDPPRSR